MLKLKIEEILSVVGGRLLTGDKNEVISSVTTDSREVGELFIPIKGKKVDGHDYIESFFEHNGKAVITSREADGRCVILVEDTKAALGKLAAYCRERSGIQIVGLTGSVGKTSTRGMIASVLRQKFSTWETVKNYNNDIGVPLTLFGIEQDHEIAVIEMGMNHLGEISLLTSIAKPNVAVITNIGTAHIGNLGGRENILKAKLEIIEGLPEDGLLILNGDDDMLWSIRSELPVRTVYFGINNPDSDITATDIKLNDDSTVFSFGDTTATIPVVGFHHVYNALAAVAVGRNYGMTDREIAEGIKNYRVSGMRQKEKTVNGIKLIIDCYNASEQSMIASLNVLSQTARKRKVAVLGDMLEMGDFSEQLHRSVGDAVKREGVDLLVTVGEQAKYIAKQATGIPFECFDNNEEASEFLINNIHEGDTLLIKASRGMQFEKIAEAITERLG